MLVWSATGATVVSALLIDTKHNKEHASEYWQIAPSKKVVNK